MRCVRDNVNKRWNRNAKKEKNKTKQNKQKKITRGTETIAKGWELSDFVVHLR